MTVLAYKKETSVVVYPRMQAVADRFMIFDRSSGHWRLPRDHVRIGHLCLVDGRLHVKSADVLQRMIVLAGSVPDPELGFRMNLGKEYNVLRASSGRLMHHKDVVLVSYVMKAREAAFVLVFYRNELHWQPDLVKLQSNFMCLCRSLYDGKVILHEYLRLLEEMEDMKDTLLMLPAGCNPF